MPVYRYKFSQLSLKELQRGVLGAITVSASGPVSYVDITAGSGDKLDLDEVMSRIGYAFDSQDPTSTIIQQSTLTNSAQLKVSARAATTAALPTVTYANGTAGVGATLTATVNAALVAQDGVTLILNDRLLVKNQVATLQNGIYFVSQVGSGVLPFILTRALDCNSSTNISSTTAVFIEEGSSNADTGWLLSTNNPLTIGTTGITFIKFTASAGAFTVTQAEIDFGATGATQGFFTITDASVTGTSKIIANQDAGAATGKEQDENEFDVFQCSCLPAAGSFTLYVNSVYGPLNGPYKVNYTIG
jgi:hypothetical protein